ncbi:major facilitator superfamily domain-containing protein [Favolaschia claudopus]|uniref:Major facilitator superfamily domain-containing protein n=1 Tax=Favolaschia claudopus TaxID=2862362 RepID=A0AAW0B479_9AGAR
MTAGFGPLPLAEDHTQAVLGTTRIRGPRWAHLPTLTIGLLGVQILWSVELSYAPPYLLSLGLTKPGVAMVFLAGPLSGFVMQPIIGALADNSTSRWGRRRPYMLLGCAVCALSMLLLGYTREVATVLTGGTNSMTDQATVWLAVIAIYLVDFSVNAVQAVDRALLVDILPPSLQASGNAWAASMLGLGSLIGFFIGNLNLPTYLPFFGSTELQILSVLVVLLIVIGHLVTAVSVRETVLVRPEHHNPSLFTELKQICVSMWTLPRTIRQIVGPKPFFSVESQLNQ